MFKDKKPKIVFSRAMVGSGDLNFSFSGIKTAAVQYAENTGTALTKEAICEVSDAFEQAVVDSVLFKVKQAVSKYKVNSVVVGGGVSANTRLRESLSCLANDSTRVYFPKKEFSVDNGAMIASAAFFAGKKQRPPTIQARSGLHFD